MGSIHAHGFLSDAVLLSDDAGQFAVGRHALCWVHAERLVHKLEAFTDLHRAAQQRMRKLIWNFYADLKLYRPTPAKAVASCCGPVRSHLPPSHRLGHAGSIAKAAPCQQDRVADGAAAGKPAPYQWLENDIRCQVIRRKVSAGTRSGGGRDCRDACLRLAKACAKPSVAFRDYLGKCGVAAVDPADPTRNAAAR